MCVCDQYYMMIPHPKKTVCVINKLMLKGSATVCDWWLYCINYVAHPLYVICSLPQKDIFWIKEASLHENPLICWSWNVICMSFLLLKIKPTDFSPQFCGKWKSKNKPFLFPFLFQCERDLVPVLDIPAMVQLQISSKIHAYVQTRTL